MLHSVDHRDPDLIGILIVKLDDLSLLLYITHLRITVTGRLYAITSLDSVVNTSRIALDTISGQHPDD